MLGRPFALFSRALARAPKTTKASERKLYTDSIYPYPFNYINTKIYPSQCIYRENFRPCPWDAQETFWGLWGMRVFWFYFFINLFNDPGVIIGHHTFPDPTAWTDEELGIPPEEFGSYKEWLKSKNEED